MLRAFITQQGNVDMAAQYRQRVAELEGRRLNTGDAHVITPLQVTENSTTMLKQFVLRAVLLYPAVFCGDCITV